MSNFNQINLQDRNSLIIQNIYNFHEHLILVIIIIISFILYILTFLIINKNFNRKFSENHIIEVIWTIIPALVLIILAIPSIKILYALEEINSNISLKIIGHQWYWSYEISDFNIEFDSYILQLNNRSYRLLDIDNRLILPYLSKIRLVVSSEDVIHSWTVPSLAVKLDAVPGRLNQINFTRKRPGIYFGQCSEICGANHRFMPIAIEIISLKKFLRWK